MAEINYTVRPMREEEVPQTLDIWKETGMQEGTHCLYTWMTVDPEAIQVAVTGEGEVIGACSGVIHHEDLCFVGLYCVRKKYRGQGIGFKVWNACMKHIGKRNVCLNAGPGKLSLYRDRGGFPIVETRWMVRVNETNEAVHPENLSDTIPQGVEIIPFKDSHLPLIYEYDENLMGYSRKIALELNCKETDSRTYVAISNSTCVGFGTVKISCQEARQVGPLYANDKDIAEVLLRKLVLSLPQVKGFAMMTCSSNTAATDLIKKIGCPMPEKNERLYRNKIVDVDISKVFAQFDLNFCPY